MNGRKLKIGQILKMDKNCKNGQKLKNRQNWKFDKN